MRSTLFRATLTSFVRAAIDAEVYRPTKRLLLFLAVACCSASMASAGPNAGGILVVHDTGVGFSSDTPLPPVTAPPGSCRQVDNTSDLGIPEGNSGRIWKVYAAFPTGSSPRLMAVSWGEGLSSNGDGYVYIQAAGLPDPVSDFEVTWGGWPNTDGGNIGQTFTGGAKLTTITELYWFAGYGNGGTGADPQMFCVQPTSGCRGCLQSGETSMSGGTFADDSVPAQTDPVAGWGCLGFGQAGSTPCPPERGACCESVGTCTLVYETGCTSPTAIWHGEWVSCDPDPCAAVPVEETSWGRIKDTYR